jgi:hypothetical protein
VRQYHLFSGLQDHPSKVHLFAYFACEIFNISEVMMLGAVEVNSDFKTLLPKSCLTFIYFRTWYNVFSPIHSEFKSNPPRTKYRLILLHFFFLSFEYAKLIW